MAVPAAPTLRPLCPVARALSRGAGATTGTTTTRTRTTVWGRAAATPRTTLDIRTSAARNGQEPAGSSPRSGKSVDLFMRISISVLYTLWGTDKFGKPATLASFDQAVLPPDRGRGSSSSYFFFLISLDTSAEQAAPIENLHFDPRDLRPCEGDGSFFPKASGTMHISSDPCSWNRMILFYIFIFHGGIDSCW